MEHDTQSDSEFEQTSATINAKTNHFVGRARDKWGGDDSVHISGGGRVVQVVFYYGDELDKAKTFTFNRYAGPDGVSVEYKSGHPDARVNRDDISFDSTHVIDVDDAFDFIDHHTRHL